MADDRDVVYRLHYLDLFCIYSIYFGLSSGIKQTAGALRKADLSFQEVNMW